LNNLNHNKPQSQSNENLNPNNHKYTCMEYKFVINDEEGEKTYKN